MSSEKKAEIGSVWRHKTGGQTYEIISDMAALQCSTAPEFEHQFDDDNWMVYQNTRTGFMYVRLVEEFLDGRFERVESEAA